MMFTVRIVNDVEGYSKVVDSFVYREDALDAAWGFQAQIWDDNEYVEVVSPTGQVIYQHPEQV